VIKVISQKAASPSP